MLMTKHRLKAKRSARCWAKTLEARHSVLLYKLYHLEYWPMLERIDLAWRWLITGLLEEWHYDTLGRGEKDMTGLKVPELLYLEMPSPTGICEGLVQELDSRTLWDEYGIDEDITPFTYHFPRADIHELLSADLLHQLIKGTFKDHLVQWVGNYLYLEHGEIKLTVAKFSIAAAPAFPGIHCFPHGRRFKQWMGDDSKALMKVYLPAISGFVPTKMCPGVHPTGFNLPRQHSLVHLIKQIQEFGAPGGLCSSITESCHITAVKRLWRRSNRYEALGHMLLTNQRLDKLICTCADFVTHAMLPPTHVPPPKPVLIPDDDGDVGVIDEYVAGNVTLARTRAHTYPRGLKDLAQHIQHPELIELTQHFLYDQLHTNDGTSSANVPLQQCPHPSSKISVFHSAVATFYAPSDKSSIRGMRTEHIRSTPSWQKQGLRYDCVLVVDDEDKPGIQGMSVVRVNLLFSFTHDVKTYSCAFVEWFKHVGARPDPETGMWKVKPDTYRNSQRIISVLHLDTFLCGAHILLVFGRDYEVLSVPP
ncbi:uncharacterized protein LACBIDRAFT_331347 [Laccaria bicolor S238N-H82]|uniref:Predicted protein n=1 Tax=Laccaria bicolor (strain S238N-H82 / ATCC MYA-4686) TaxID=486041 RepID=B0DP76_LACBS|nr:uncharacterized protein LACBIDRAFT_331347 [Laccaria bicolor S238N-H82]EDR03636.1 predicted protein [Laccaria bicolor S238N-H82]|eukprot:XP_001885784.1 predicted protein [Laccaria bicolor S238N-H82]